jgi:hypothetical protein
MKITSYLNYLKSLLMHMSNNEFDSILSNVFCNLLQIHQITNKCLKCT